MSALPNHHLSKTFFDDHEIIEEAAGYASKLSEQHYVLSRLGVSISDYWAAQEAQDLIQEGIPQDRQATDQECLHYFLNKGFSRDQIYQILEDGFKQRGLILALSPDIMKDFPSGDGDPEEGDLQINCPDGLPYTYIVGLQVLGESERQWLEELKRSSLKSSS